MRETDPGLKRERLVGLAYTVAAFLFWGMYPPYWKLLDAVPDFQVIAHRVIWACVFTALIMTLQRRWGEVKAALASWKTVLTLVASGACISANWSIYIIGVLSGRILAVSMGYFINPLVSVLLGVVVLRERLRFWQIVAVICAFSGVVYMSVRTSGVPWISLILAFSFGTYGLLRKTVAVKALPGTFAETLLISPLAITFLLIAGFRGNGVVGSADLQTHLFLLGSGVVTAIPIIWFASGARRIPLSLVGFLQYMAPTCQMLLGIYLYGEIFTRTHLISFSLIWIGIIIFTTSSFLQRGRRQL